MKLSVVGVAIAILVGAIIGMTLREFTLEEHEFCMKDVTGKFTYCETHSLWKGSYSNQK